MCRRSDAELAASIQRGLAEKKEKIGAIFCHADVRGAFMNDNMASGKFFCCNIFAFCFQMV